MAPQRVLVGIVVGAQGVRGRVRIKSFTGDPMAVADMISRPTDPAQVNFQDWRVSDVDYLVIGRMAESGPNNYGLQFQLFNVRSGEQLLAFRLTSARADLRAAAVDFGLGDGAGLNQAFDAALGQIVAVAAHAVL